MLLMSLGSSAFMSSKLRVIPSTITSGAFPVYDVTPRIITFGFAPGAPFENMFTPGRPCNASSILTGFKFCTCSSETVETEPEILAAF